MKKLFAILLLFSILGCSSDDDQNPIEKLPTNAIKIGEQIWMKENLKVMNFKNGEPLKRANSTEEWVNYYNEKTSAYASYLWDSNNESVYGLIYNYYALNDSRGCMSSNQCLPRVVKIKSQIQSLTTASTVLFLGLPGVPISFTF